MSARLPCHSCKQGSQRQASHWQQARDLEREHRQAQGVVALVQGLPVEGLEVAGVREEAVAPLLHLPLHLRQRHLRTPGKPFVRALLVLLMGVQVLQLLPPAVLLLKQRTQAQVRPVGAGRRVRLVKVPPVEETQDLDIVLKV